MVVWCEGGWVDGGGTGGQFVVCNVRLPACNYSEDCQNVKLQLSRWEHEMEVQDCVIRSTQRVIFQKLPKMT